MKPSLKRVMGFVRVANQTLKEFGLEWLRGIRFVRVTEEGKEKYIIRPIWKFPSEREYGQPLEYLSTSDKPIIGLITVLVDYRLEIVEEYGRDAPIVTDKSLLSLNPERFERTLDELKKYGKYAIITRLAKLRLRLQQDEDKQSFCLLLGPRSHEFL